MPSTYTPIATTTLGSSASTVTFSSISGAYTDLVLVASTRTTETATDGYYNLYLNTNNAGVWSYTRLSGNGSAASSDRSSNNYAGLYFDTAAASAASGTFGTTIHNFQNYSNATTYKTVLNRVNSPTYVKGSVYLWRDTSAINKIELASGGGNFAAGSTFTLYGVKSA